MLLYALSARLFFRHYQMLGTAEADLGGLRGKCGSLSFPHTLAKQGFELI